MRTTKRTCPICGKEFIVTPKGQKVYCSLECFKEQRKIREDEKRRAIKKRALERAENAKGLDEILHELHRYNKAHGTMISYGQWMAGVRAS